MRHDAREPKHHGGAWRDTLIDAAMFREWIVNVGQRPAVSRLAHLVVELCKRLASSGYAENVFEMPLNGNRLASQSA